MIERYYHPCTPKHLPDDVKEVFSYLHFVLQERFPGLGPEPAISAQIELLLHAMQEVIDQNSETPEQKERARAMCFVFANSFAKKVATIISGAGT